MVLPSSPWSLASCSSEGKRDELIAFWLGAPRDQLESLWASGFGAVTREMVLTLNSDTTFTQDQITLRNEISAIFNREGLSQPLSQQLMLANFLLSPPGLLTINNVEQFFPAWLANAYKDLYEVVPQQAQPSTPAEPSSVSQSSAAVTNPSAEPEVSIPPAPDFGPFPTSLEELLSNRIQLNRLLGLSNLYYIDPEDQEIKDELLQVRTALAQAIANTPEEKLEHLWSTELGDRYWALVRSGIQKESLSSIEEKRKQDAVSKLNPSIGGGFGTPGALNAFLIAMIYFLPGSMQVDGADQKLPAWLLPHYQQIFVEALPA